MPRRNLVDPAYSQMLHVSVCGHLVKLRMAHESSYSLTVSDTKITVVFGNLIHASKAGFAQKGCVY